MLLSFYTLRAQAREWSRLLCGATILDVYSQSKAQLSIELNDREQSTLFLQLGGPLRSLYRRKGHRKARRNVASQFPLLTGDVVLDVLVAERDRHLFLALESGRKLQVVLFGPRPNAYLTEDDALISDAFLAREAWIGKAAPSPRAAPVVTEPGQFESRWDGAAQTTLQALVRAMPLFNRTLAAEALARTNLNPHDGPGISPDALEALFRTCTALEEELDRPRPRIYRTEEGTPHFALLPLVHLEGALEEVFGTVDEAVERFVRRQLSERAFEARRAPLDSAAAAAEDQLQKSLLHLSAALDTETRADRYERFGHLLMASAHAVPSGAPDVELSDYFAPGATVRIPLDPALTAVENAERFYQRARQLRAARSHAERRLDATQSRLARIQRVRQALQQVRDSRELDAFEAEHAADLSQLKPRTGDATEGPSFRHFLVEGRYQVLVGKNARQNDALTFKVARKHDLWFHARGVQGSHVIMRLPGRSTTPSRHAIDQAASIAAYFSKASGSELTPVIVTPRKFVRKKKGGPAGAVVVEREEVVLVPPRLPSSG